MNRIMVYPSAIPLETDLLSAERYAMEAVGYLMQAVLGTTTVVSGLACTPTSPASLTINVGPGCITQLATVDANSFSSLTSDSDPLMKMGINLSSTPFTLTAPTTSGQSINYMIQGTFQETDNTPVTLPYYNANDPTQPWSGPSNSGTPQNTVRAQLVQLQIKAGASANTGTQATPAVDNGWTGLWVITVNFGQTQVTSSSISAYPNSPFLAGLLNSHHGGVPGQAPKINLTTEVSGILPAGNGGSVTKGVQIFTSSNNFTVPANVTQVEVLVRGAGAGSWGSTTSLNTHGAGSGAISRKLISGLTPGQTIAVTVGSPGTAGAANGGAGGNGGTSSFGAYCSATGGTTAASMTVVGLGGTASGGDENIPGSEGRVGAQQAFQSHGVGGDGGSCPLGGAGGTGNAVGTGQPGVFPGGGAAGSSSLAASPGAAGAGGEVVVRW